MKYLLCILGMVLSVSVTFAQSNYMVIMGGGGEPKRNYTIFDNEVERVGDFVKSNQNWNAEITFNGGHSQTEQIIREKFGRRGISNKDFTSESYQKTINDYVSKIKSGQIKKGDQLMVFINTHGGAKKGKTHTLATTQGVVTDYDRLNGGTVSVDAVEELTKIASEKGIKLALIDFSCHSGNTMALKNPNTCVITSTGPDHYGYGGTRNTFTAIFTDNLKKGRSLEDVYLESRKLFYDESFPMISSPLGVELQEEMYRPITPFLFYYDASHNKFTPYMEKELKEEDPYCINGVGVDSLIQLSKEAESFNKLSLMSLVGEKNMGGFNKAVRAYHQHLKEIYDELIGQGAKILAKKEQFCHEYSLTKNSKSKECTTYTYENILTIDFDNVIKYFNEQVAKNKGKDQKTYLAMVEVLKKAKARKGELLAEYPNLAKYKDYYKTKPGLESKTRDLASDVSRESQKLYYALYKQRSLEDKRPNPCKDFVL